MKFLYLTFVLCLYGSLLSAESLFPTPKQIAEQGAPVLLKVTDDPQLYLVTCGTNRQVEIGLDLIRNRFSSLQKKIMADCTFADAAHQQGIRVYIGTVGENDTFDRIIKSFEVQLTPDKPGWQGYVIEVKGKGEQLEILVAGCDRIGTLYGCVTFAHFLDAVENGMRLTPHRVRDWPDFRYRCVANAYPPNVFSVKEFHDEFDRLISDRKGDEEVRVAGERYEQEARYFLDWMTWNKINRFLGPIPNLRSARQVKVVNRIGEYMEDRGISNFRSQTPFVGTAKENRRGCARLGNGEFCWSDDDKLSHIAQNTVEMLRQTHINHFMLHLVDHDGPDPEHWSKRCDTCRERFGNDRAAADFNVFKIFYDTIRKGKSDCVFELVPVPYKAWPFYEKAKMELSIEWQEGNPETEEKMRMSQAAIEYFHRLDALLPKDVYIALREHGRIPTVQYCEAFGNRPITMWDFQFPVRGWQTFFHNMGRYAKTWYFKNRPAMLFMTSVDRPLLNEITELYNHEFAWNVNAPGSALLEEAYDYHNDIRLLEPEDVTFPFIERACRQLYGKAVYRQMAEVYKLNLSLMFIVRPRVARVINGESHRIYTDDEHALVDRLPMMKAQAFAAEKTVIAMQKLFSQAPSLNRWAEKHATYLYRYAVPARYVAGARALRWESERALLGGDYRRAEALAQQGRKLLVARAADVELMNRQLSEYPKVSIEANTVEKELATFNFQSLEADFEEIIELAGRPKAIHKPVLVIGTSEIGDDSRVSVRVSAMPYEPQPGLMSCPGFVSARSVSDGLELRIRIRRGGMPLDAFPVRPHDGLWQEGSISQMGYFGIYVRRKGSSDVQVFMFDPKGNRLDGLCRGDIVKATLAEWDQRWHYHVFRRPDFRDGIDFSWNPNWKVSIAKQEHYLVAEVHISYESLGLTVGNADTLRQLEFVFEHYWRSNEPFRPAELGRAGEFNGRWVPVEQRLVDF